MAISSSCMVPVHPIVTTLEHCSNMSCMFMDYATTAYIACRVWTKLSHMLPLKMQHPRLTLFHMIIYTTGRCQLTDLGCGSDQEGDMDAV